MKKLLLMLLNVVLVLTLALSLSACGGGGEAEDPEDPKDPGSSHVHETTAVDSKAPSCDADGNSAYYSCTCGKYFSDAGATTEIAQDSWLIPATHTFADTWSYDATNHWKAAICSHDTEKAENAAHTMENGACTTCAYVIGVEVDADAWKNAFGSIKNVTIADIDYDSAGRVEYYTVYKFDLYDDSHFGQVQTYTYEGTDGVLAEDWYAASYHHYYVDGNGNLDADSYFHQYASSDGLSFVTGKISYNKWKEQHDKLYDFLSFFKYNYSKFLYNSETGTYVLKGNANLAWEYNTYYTVKSAEARFDNLGNLVSFEYEYKSGSNAPYKMVISDIGTTVIVPVADGPIDPSTSEN